MSEPSPTTTQQTVASGGELLARAVFDAGVEVIFGVHGGHLDAFLVEADRLGIRIIDHRHEAAAGNAAEGYARSTGKLAVAFATSGPGFANVFSSMANASTDRISVLYITSSPPLRETELNVLQDGLDQVAAARSVSKWAHRATTVSRIPDLVALAVRHAATGVPGPVLIDVPIDIMFRTIDTGAVDTTASLTLPAPPSPAPEAVDALVETLARASYPIVLVGGGATSSPGCRAALEEFVEKVPLPVYGVSWGLGLLDPEHPCWCGNSVDAATVRHMAAEPDVVVILGARRGGQLGGRTGTMVPDGATIVQVDLDGTQAGRIGNVAVSVVADVAQTLRALAGQADRLPGWSEWTDKARSSVGAHAFMYADAEPDCDDGAHPYWATKAVVEAAGLNSTVVYDGGEVAAWASFFARASKPRSWFGLGNMGGLGVGQGLAIGAQVARPDERVVLITGDGGVGFHLQEFETMARHRLPIVVVVMNNLCWGMSVHGQEVLFGPGTAVAVELPDVRYDKIAESMGCHGELVTAHADIGPALERAFASGRPSCLDVRISRTVMHPMMADLTADLPEGYIRVPYYEAIPASEA